MSAFSLSDSSAPGGLLAVLAHPDDESFGPGGTLARYAAEGYTVHLLTITDGALGEGAPELMEGNIGLPELRATELRCAARALGVASLRQLNYRDSGMPGSPHNQHPDCLLQAEDGPVIEEIRRVLKETRPAVVITHDPTGGYFHPDHIRTSALTTAAFRAIQGPQRLYYSVLPRTFIRWAVLFLRLLRQDPTRFGRNHDVDLTRLGAPSDLIHARIDVGPYLATKGRAMACHRSQGGGDKAPPLALPPWLQRRLLGTESFTQACPPPPPGMHRKSDLFHGLPSG